MATTNLDALSTQYIKAFNDTMRMSLHNVRGGMMREYCETMTMATLEAGVFFRNEGQKARDVVPNVFDSTRTGFVGAGEGDAKGQRRFEVKPTYCFWVEVLPITDINKSMFKPDSSFMQQAFSSLKLKEDIKIIDSLIAKEALFRYKFGDPTKFISDPANVLALRKAINLVCSFATTRTSGIENPQDKGAIIMNALDYNALNGVGGGTGNDDLLINQNFRHITGRNGNLIETLFGMPILVYQNFQESTDWDRTAVVPAGTIYVIPDKSIGFVEWEGQISYTAEYQKLNSNVMVFHAMKSGGAVAIDTEFMVKVSCLPYDFSDVVTP